MKDSGPLAGDAEQREAIRALLQGLETEVFPRGDSAPEIQAIIDRLNASDGSLKARVIDEGLHAALRDNSHAWRLELNGAYRLLRPLGKQQPMVAQYALADKLGQSADAAEAA